MRAWVHACRSVGRKPVYVDLEAEVVVDKDNPPDLKKYAEEVGTPIAAAPADASGAAAVAAAGSAAGAAPAPRPAAATPAKMAAPAAKKGAAKAAAPTQPRADVQAVTETVVAKVGASHLHSTSGHAALPCLCVHAWPCRALGR